ncbi:MAG: cysteine desulfurase CsdA [Ignavibacteriales bacterium CG_4_9_14_3_um_filter_34_10]|nr:MAG: cysteine desulfurase CsdA [Ignavibacteriales bacterium CG_4_9_14_3_um_filter_34_10]
MLNQKATLESIKRKFDVQEIRKDFPILSVKVNGKPLVYIDNAATTQKPDVVIESMKYYYTHENANIHRGLYFLSEAATQSYETSRMKVKEFINAMSASEIIFVRGTTEAINLLSSSFCKSGMIKEGDEIIISYMEHHANIVPWQLVCERNKAKLRVIPISDEGELLLEEFEPMINEKTKIVSIVHTSNSLGTINPIKEIIKIAHRHGVPVMVDAAQAIQHTKIDVQELDCDFLAFSGHKIYGPTGIGVLYGKTEYMNMLPPYQGGGDMIRTVTFEKTTFDDLPNKFEAGTPNIAGGIGLGVALKYISSFNFDDIQNHEKKLLEYATQRMLEIDGLKIIGTAKNKTAVISFVIDGLHPYDIGTIVDNDGIAIRTGHHCTQPIMQRFNVSATARASFGIYNTLEEIDIFVESLRKAIKLFR